MSRKGRKARILNTQNPVSSKPDLSLDAVLQAEQQIQIQKQLALQKAYSSNDVNEILKADNYLQSVKGKKDEGIKSIIVDPLDVAASFGYKEKPFQLSYDMLRAMGKTNVPHMIIKTRLAQIKKHCAPAPDKYSTGFVVEPKGRWRSTQKDKKLTPAEQKKAEAITQFILDCGDGTDSEADTMERFVGKLMQDSMDMDQATAEMQYDRIGRLKGFVATDAGTYRRAMFSETDEVPLMNGKKPVYAQLYQGNVYNYFYEHELLFGIRNPSTDIRTYGYGKSELEDMIALITSLLNADNYNGNFFKVGSSPQGILTYTGNVNQATLNDFRQSWQQEVAGSANSHKIPLINADKVNFIPTGVANRDMEFSKYQEFMIKVGCAIFIIDPSEIGFPMAGASDSGDGMGGRNNSEKLKYSKDKGLSPLLTNLQYWYNRKIIAKLDPGFEMRFVGVGDAEDKETELEQDIKRVGNFMTVNEIRAKHNLSPIDGMDIILNPVASQAAMMAQQGNPDSNEAIDNMQQGNDQPNPFLKSLQSDLGRLLS